MLIEKKMERPTWQKIVLKHKIMQLQQAQEILIPLNLVDFSPNLTSPHPLS